MTEINDEEIAAEVQSGNSQAFATIISRYEPKLTRYARRFIFDSVDIQDLVQEIFIKVYTNIKSFNTKMKFSPWIYRIAHNEFINAIKKRGNEKVVFFDFDVVLPHLYSKSTSEDDFRSTELRTLLDNHLSEIDVKYREPLVLYYFDEFDYGEIADILKIPVSTVGVRLRRGKALLKKKLKDKKIYE